MTYFDRILARANTRLLVMTQGQYELKRRTEALNNRSQSGLELNVVDHYNGEENFPGLRLCAKTGTAELGDGNSHAWFVGFLADDKHPYAFVTLIERGGYGLSTAGPIANEVLQWAVENEK